MGFFVLGVFVLCAIYVQNRGKVQHDKLARKLNDHSNFLAPINCLFYAFSAIEKKPYIDVNTFPELKVLQDNWKTIRDEAKNLHKDSHIKASDERDDLAFNSFFRTGWKRFYLSWYGADLKSAKQLCPQTLALLKGIPNIKAAMFAMLPPGARLVKHRDPFAGSLRYHLGLITPNSNDCYINVDGEKYAWRDGEPVMFDETYIHYAENKSDQNRIVLFLDVKRPVKLFIIDWVNSLVSRVLMSATASKNASGDKVGFLNRVFPQLYKIRLVGKKIKSFNRPLYYLIQYSLYGLLIYWLFF
ncbi:MAG: lipid A hydroxylase LpxO [Alteromonadaceae bacterium]|nr:MAG: lipid A hydroxylase LpxO [Alteromonadaceae bacterium]